MDVIDILRDKSIFPVFKSYSDSEAEVFFNIGELPIGEETGENGELVLLWENNKNTSRTLAVRYLLEAITREGSKVIE